MQFSEMQESTHTWMNQLNFTPIAIPHILFKKLIEMF